MNTKPIGSVAVATALALGIAASGTNARAEEKSASEESPRVSPDQQRLADAALKLENAFNDQFVAGTIDRSALAGPIDEVVQAAPEAARAKISAHIDRVLETGAALASRMTPEQRAAVVTPPENIGKTEQAQLVGFGWPGAVGWGGLGAFGFPAGYGLGFGLNGVGLGWGGGWGWGNGLGWGW